MDEHDLCRHFNRLGGKANEVILITPAYDIDYELDSYLDDVYEWYEAKTQTEVYCCVCSRRAYMRFKTFMVGFIVKIGVTDKVHQVE